MEEDWSSSDCPPQKLFFSTIFLCHTCPVIVFFGALLQNCHQFWLDPSHDGPLLMVEGLG
jgi:hypothetical protein